MQQQIGEFIRQTRRQQNRTQSQLGGERYSKSYVSAVERDKISPSTDALHYFATQLQYPNDYFTVLFQDINTAKEITIPHGDAVKNLSETNGSVLHNETLTLLDILLANVEASASLAYYELPVLPSEVFTSLPAQKQARYYYLMGLVAQERKDYPSARQSFEYALFHASAEQQVAILDELGRHSYLTQAYQTALSYHLRALDVLKKLTLDDNGATTAQFFKVELHCGDDYRVMGAYEQACIHYENARLLLQPHHDIRTAGLLYQGLGYCLYAALYQRTVVSLPDEQRASLEEMEREFQRAVGFLLQSRTLFQVSGDKVGECQSRLLQALVLIDLGNRCKQYSLKEKVAGGNSTFTYGPALLNEAEEQCRQVLMHWQNPEEETPLAQPTEQQVNIYVALAYLIRIHTLRASLARLSGYNDTAKAELNVAAYLCEQVLASLVAQELPLQELLRILSPQTQRIAQRYPSVNQLSLPPSNGVTCSPEAQVEVYFATSEVAVELGCSATDPEYAHYCYDHATHCMQETLAIARSQKSGLNVEPHYKLRCYQRSLDLLEERNLIAPEYAMETNKALLQVLEASFHDMLYPTLPRVS